MSLLVNLLLAEREHNSLWWTALHEMLTSRELPEWVATQKIGTHADREQYEDAQRATNLAVFGIPLVAPGDVLPMISGEPQTLINLIEAERTFAIRWWTMLNECRCKRQLPARVIKLSVGHAPDMDLWLAKAGAVNLALFKTEYVRDLAAITKRESSWLQEALAG